MAGRILIVEDDGIIATRLQTILEKLGYDVIGAVASGAEAVQKASESSPDLVLMDIYLAGEMNGIETAAEIHTQSDIPIVYLTAYSTDELLQQAKITQPYGYLIKPIQDRELYATIEMALYRHELEARLKENERWLDTTLRSIGDAVITTDEQGSVTFMNQISEELTGWKQEEASGHGLAEVFHIANEDTGEPVENPVVRVIRDGVVVGLGNHTLLFRKDGTAIPIDDSAAPIRNDRGDITGVVLVFRDVTERRQAMKQLQESEEKYHSLYSAMNEGVCLHEVIYDESGKAVDYRILDINPSYESITGLGRGQAIGSLASELYGSGEPPYMDVYAKVADSGQPTSFETYFPPMDKHFSISVFSPGESMFATVFSDITARKRMEEELMKVQKLESIGVLAGGIAHDLNNLLTGILGNISLARMYEDPAERNRRLVEAEKASMQVKDLTQRLLTFSRGGAPILQTTAIGELLKDCTDLALSGSNVRCEFSIPDDLWPAEIDAGQINQVISNLIINANQAMPDGGVIKIDAENVEVEAEHGLPLSPGAYVRISIVDRGVGIAREHLQRVFDPFFTTKQKGSGLGLATAFSIVNQHNGYITAESELGVGTAFHVYLPTSPDQMPVGESKEKTEPITGEGRILVMDDEAHIRDLATEMLGRCGYRATTAMDGAEAIELYKKAMESGNPFHAVIMDLTVPGGMGGKETIQLLNEIDPDVKAIVSSGYSNDPVMAEFREYGFKGVIAKPYKLMELSEIMHKVLTGNAL
ncbi:response regulator [Candidatus Poribacteria bacterium]